MNLQQLKENWSDCRRCGLCQFRRQVVLGRGVSPAEVMMIGEGPGRSEDLRGEAFVGPSGYIMNRALQTSKILCQRTPTIYFTNVVGCRPTDRLHGPNREPTGEEALACWPRLESLYQVVRPSRVIFLGRVAERFCKRALPQGRTLNHPSYIARLGGAGTPAFQRFVREISEVFRSLSEEETW